MTAILEIKNLTGGYGDTNVIFDLSARIVGGQVLGVFGRNGVGKTTLIAAMRCYVASKLGDTVEIPAELLTN